MNRGPGDARPYQRASDGLWVAAIPAGFTATGARRRVTVSAKTEAACKRRLRDRRRELEAGEATTGRITVKQWADQYLVLRRDELRPKAYNAAASPIRKWVIPTIGHKRLGLLTPADVRAVGDAQRREGQQAAATQRVLMTMLRWAIREGHHVPSRVLLVKAPPVPKSDRLGMTLEEGIACLEAASQLPHGTRWLVTLLYGMREGECLGLTWDSVDFDAGEFGEIRVDWQLQAMPYNTPRDRTSGFRIPPDLEVRHLVDAWHLSPPKTKQGFRVAPMLPEVRDPLLRWREVAPDNPWGLVWPTTTGRPANPKHDLAEWHAIQGTAGVGHPAGRPYLVHECRNFAATMLGELGVDPHVITALLGHSSILTSRGYMNTPRGPLQAAMTRVGERLRLPG